MARWPLLHTARAGREADAVAAYRLGLELEPPAAERAFIARRIRHLSKGCRY